MEIIQHKKYSNESLLCHIVGSDVFPEILKYNPADTGIGRDTYYSDSTLFH